MAGRFLWGLHKPYPYILYVRIPPFLVPEMFGEYSACPGRTWRIIPVSKWLGSPPFISHKKAIWKGSHNPILTGLRITMVINHVS